MYIKDNVVKIIIGKRQKLFILPNTPSFIALSYSVMKIEVIMHAMSLINL